MHSLRGRPPSAPPRDRTQATQDAANIRLLTSLRFFAALWVVLFHDWPKLDVGFTPALVDKGYLGVELLFVLSGFILCHAYLSALGEGRFRTVRPSEHRAFSCIWARSATRPT